MGEPGKCTGEPHCSSSAASWDPNRGEMTRDGPKGEMARDEPRRETPLPAPATVEVGGALAKATLRGVVGLEPLESGQRNGRRSFSGTSSKALERGLRGRTSGVRSVTLLKAGLAGLSILMEGRGPGSWNIRVSRARSTSKAFFTRSATGPLLSRAGSRELGRTSSAVGRLSPLRLGSFPLNKVALQSMHKKASAMRGKGDGALGRLGLMPELCPCFHVPPLLGALASPPNMGYACSIPGDSAFSE